MRGAVLVIWIPSLPIRVPCDPVGVDGDPDAGSDRRPGEDDRLEIADPDGRRTWIVDAGFLRSHHRCIYGAGCQGIGEERAPELALGCCSVGAQLVDDDDVQTVVSAFVRLDPRLMQHHQDASRHGFLRPTDDGRTATRLVDGACIFLNRPGFEGGVGCALHLAAVEAGERPLDWKPNVCWQVPIRLEHSTDDHGHVISRLREWKRRDWGEGGDDFHWWCTESPDAFVGAEPVYRASRDEIVELVGQQVYDLMVEILERPVAVPLAHPTLRRA